MLTINNDIAQAPGIAAGNKFHLTLQQRVGRSATELVAGDGMHTLGRPAALPHIAGRPKRRGVCECLVNRSEHRVVVTLAAGVRVVKPVPHEAPERFARDGRLPRPECGLPFLEPFALRFQRRERVSQLGPVGSARDDQFPQLPVADRFAHLPQLGKAGEQVVARELPFPLRFRERL